MRDKVGVRVVQKKAWDEVCVRVIEYPHTCNRVSINLVIRYKILVGYTGKRQNTNTFLITHLVFEP